MTARVSARTKAQSSRVALASGGDDDASAAAAATTRGGAKRTSSRKMACPGAEGGGEGGGNTVVARSRGTGPASRSRLRSACRRDTYRRRSAEARSSADDDDAEEDDDEEEDDMAPRERSDGVPAKGDDARSDQRANVRRAAFLGRGCRGAEETP